MRQKFIEEDAAIYYMVVEWAGAKLSWKEFREHIIGPTNPKAADPNSIRGKIFNEWKSLNLKRAPDIMENAIHASASAYESVLERAAWLKLPMFTDPLLIAFLSAGVSPQSVTDWMLNPQVKGMPVFDHFDELGFEDCITKASELYQSQSTVSRTIRLHSVAGGHLRPIMPREPVKLTALGTGNYLWPRITLRLAFLFSLSLIYRITRE
jgi:hypothetical protein